MSGDIFKKAFSKSVEEGRQRTSGGTTNQKKTKRDFVRDIKADIENLISQIPPVFEVSDVHFHEGVSFVVHLPQHGSGILFEKTVLEVRIIVPDDEKSTDLPPLSNEDPSTTYVRTLPVHVELVMR